MLSRLKSVLTLTPGIYLLVIWMLVLSDSPILGSKGILEMAAWGLLISFGSAYSITLFLSLRDDAKK
jgi:hypothetical protein